MLKGKALMSIIVNINKVTDFLPTMPSPHGVPAIPQVDGQERKGSFSVALIGEGYKR